MTNLGNVPWRFRLQVQTVRCWSAGFSRFGKKPPKGGTPTQLPSGEIGWNGMAGQSCPLCLVQALPVLGADCYAGWTAQRRVPTTLERPAPRNGRAQSRLRHCGTFFPRDGRSNGVEGVIFISASVPSSLSYSQRNSLITKNIRQRNSKADSQRSGVPRLPFCSFRRRAGTQLHVIR